MRYAASMSKLATSRQPSHAVVLACAVVVTALVTFFLTTYSNVRSVVVEKSALEPVGLDKKCEFPIVYLKPPKTASSFIQTVVLNWSQTVGRPSYICADTPLLTSVILPDCLPQVAEPCAVFSSHIFFNKRARGLLEERMPGYKTVVSTRFPPHRIVSMYMFVNNLRESDPDLFKGLDYYLTGFNPWRHFNYLTGETRTGECPLTYEDRRDIANVASLYDVVIDVNALEESNAILKHFNMFTLPAVSESSDREKHRGAAKLTVPEAMLQKLRSKVCVEEELHRAFQIRMASLYEKITGVSCFVDGHWKKLDNCIMKKERQTLQGSWTI